MDERVVAWFSCGAASAIAAKMALRQHGARIVIAYCETGAEHPDNARFLRDCEAWFGQSVERIRSQEYADTWDVWERRRYIAGIAGAPCTTELKVRPRLAFQRPSDVHVFGYTADGPDIVRAEAMRDNYPELTIETPLIDGGVNKSACLALLQSAGIEPPVTYAMGFPNANCLPCCKATSPAYWALVRVTAPLQFERMALLSRKLGARLARLDGNRVFIDEIPADHPITQPVAPACDFLCHLIEQDITPRVEGGSR